MNDFSRRKFLELVAAASSARALAGCSAADGGARNGSSSLSDPTQRPDGGAQSVIVLGGGLAGLCSAYELRARGYTVLAVLEAQARAGGRVYTIRDGFAQGQYAEAGATRIADSHNFTMQYAFQTFNLKQVAYSTTNPSLYNIEGQSFVHQDGQAWPSFLKLTSAEQSLSATKLVHRFENLTELGDATAVTWPTGKALDYDKYTYAQYLAESKASGLSANTDVLDLNLANNGGSVQNEGALYALMSDIVDAKWNKTYAIGGGNDQLPAAFAASLGDIVQLQCVVTSVAQDQSGVTVTYTSADGVSHTVQADIAVCALPFPPLRKVDLSGAALSDEKIDVITNLQMQPVSRCNLQLKSRFWNSQGIGGLKLVRTDLPIERMWDLSSVQDGDMGLLVAYMQSGTQFSSLLTPAQQVFPGPVVTDPSTNAAVDFVLQNVEKCFPEIREQLACAIYKCWDLDPWVGGGWSAYGPGDMSGRFPAAKQREGRIYFAGEHTSCWSGWMQGALESANRVVAEITAG